MLFQCWASVEDGRPTLKQHRMNVSCLPGVLRTTLYPSTTIRIQACLTLTARGPSESDVFRRQILTTQVDTRAVRVNIFLMTVDP